MIMIINALSAYLQYLLCSDKHQMKNEIKRPCLYGKAQKTNVSLDSVYIKTDADGAVARQRCNPLSFF